MDKKAAVLAYKRNDNAPHVTGKGNGELAERIIAQARMHNIPIAESPELVNMLMGLDIGQEIPENLYEAVAHVLYWAYTLKPEESPPAT